MRSNDTGMSGQREPQLAAAEAEHAARVHGHIAAEILAAGGWLSFERFMDVALYAPGLGYYSAGAHKFGGGGDFTTAPEISALFGACVARQCAEVLAAVGRGGILEIGAGSGRLAADVLGRLERSGELPEHYWILEISADLRERQRRLLGERLPHLMGRVMWLDAPPVQPFDGVILANEVLDALPVARFRRRRSRVEELGVAVDGDRFIWAARDAGRDMAGAVDVLARAAAAAGAGEWPDGYLSEYCPRLAEWTAAVTRPLAAGAVLWFDYGLPRAHYYLPERHDGTLLCHFRHRAHADPLRLPGLEDITAWVDFTALALAAAGAGFEVAGFTTQTYFLAGLGVDQEMLALAQSDENRFARLANEARRLMLPGEMGERFKAMAWTRGMRAALGGFALRDLRHVL
jgi:SAM-dependent MidA family methyltransferase